MTDHKARAREIATQFANNVHESLVGEFVIGEEEHGWLVSAIAKALEETEEAEREACAKIAENALGYGGVPCKQAAVLIRSRTPKET